MAHPHLATLSIFAIAVLVLAACERQADAVTAVREDALAQAPYRTTTGVDFTISESGVPRAHILAYHMAEYDGGDSTYAILTHAADSASPRVVVTVFDQAGDTSATIQSDEVYYYRDTDRYEARGDVVVVTSEQRRLESEHLEWDEPEAKVRTPGFVRITTPDERIQGYELVADEDLVSYTLARVTGQVTVRD